MENHTTIGESPTRLLIKQGNNCTYFCPFGDKNESPPISSSILYINS